MSPMTFRIKIAYWYRYHPDTDTDTSVEYSTHKICAVATGVVLEILGGSFIGSCYFLVDLVQVRGGSGEFRGCSRAYWLWLLVVLVGFPGI